MTEQTTVTARPATPSERFTAEALRQYAANAGNLQINEYEKTLLQHIFIKVDMSIQEFNVNLSKSQAKGYKKDQPAMSWQNIDIKALALKAVNRAELGIDALIPGHLYPIAYWKEAAQVYDIDLRIGYKGEIYYVRQASERPISDIRVELVHASDEFAVYKKDSATRVEGYTFRIKAPFERGPVVGGYAYIEYEDEKLNKLVVMSLSEIMKRKPDTNSDFWNKWPEEMQQKTLVHAAVKQITLDPKKVNSSALAAVEADEEASYTDEEQENGIDLVLVGDSVADQAAALPEASRAVPEQASAPQSAKAAEPVKQDDDMPDFLRDMERKNGGRKAGF